MDKIKKRIRETRAALQNGAARVLKDDGGAEMIEIAIGIALAAVLIVVVILVVNKAKSKANQANDALDNIDIPK